MARERTIEEVAEDLDRVIKQVQKLSNRFDNAPFVRSDLHSEQIRHIRDELAGVRTLLMWTLGILAMMFASGVILAITTIARGVG